MIKKNSQNLAKTISGPLKFSCAQKHFWNKNVIALDPEMTIEVGMWRIFFVLLKSFIIWCEILSFE